ncbi:MAG: hypothetical protein M1820_008925 [Bogoriella megaspora]|nr:MAG: hypothetical protein M1820_008925 [Bogoriella megaspora]
MGPRRKKSKPNDKVPAADPTTDSNNASNEPINGSVAKLDSKDFFTSSVPSIDGSRSSKPTREDTGNNTNNDREDAASRRSWYGSWKSKAPAMAQLAKDATASASKSSLNLAKESTDDREAKESPAAKYMERRLGTPRKSNPSLPTMSLVNAEGSSRKSSNSEKTLQREQPGEIIPEAPLPPDPIKQHVKSDGASDDDKKTTTGGQGSQRPVSAWFGWWSRPDGYTGDTDKSGDAAKAAEAATEVAENTALPDSPAEERKKILKEINTENGNTTLIVPQENNDSEARPPDSATSIMSNPPESGKSWFNLWSKSENQKSSSSQKSNGKEETADEATTKPQNQAPEAERKVEPAPETPTQTSTKAVPKASAWAFWSKEPKDDAKSSIGDTQKQVGEIAVADTPSQSHPEAAQFNEQKAPSIKQPPLAKPNERKRKQQTAAIASSKSTPAASPPLKPSIQSKSADKISELADKEVAATTSKSTTLKPEKASQKRQRDAQPPPPPNLLLPSLQDTYPLYQPSSYWDSIRRLILSSTRNPNAPQHVDLLPSNQLPRIRRALAIGVHGFFPAQFLQMILGQPTGTSIRFANAAAKAVERWVEQYQPSTTTSPTTDTTPGSPTGGSTALRRSSTKTLRSERADIEIEKVALEGEGMVADRVDALWKLLLNWLDSIRRADFIMVAAHSQGVPVAIQLVAKLLQFGCVRDGVRVGICAMAGINMGPFAELKSRFLAGSAVELFDFALTGSRVRQNYEAALETCLSKGVRISFIGSLDDQLVSLESSTFTPLTHPLIYRAVFVNSSTHAPDFLTHLVGFALKLRNLGIPDHNLIRELSGPLAGSLYTGDGHSRLYDDDQVFSRAVEFALQSTDPEGKGGVMPRMETRGASEVAKEKESVNPFFLPWAMRGVLEEPEVKERMGDEVQELVRLFEEWRPVSKVLKDVKFRLEAVRSKL